MWAAEHVKTLKKLLPLSKVIGTALNVAFAAAVPKVVSVAPDEYMPALMLSLNGTTFMPVPTGSASRSRTSTSVESELNFGTVYTNRWTTQMMFARDR